MAVEVLFLSVILCKESMTPLDPSHLRTLHRLFRWEPDWFREDHHLMATSLMAPSDVRRFGKVLQSRLGLTWGRHWSVVDMATGPTAPTPWLVWREDQGSFPSVHLSLAAPGPLMCATSRVPGMSAAAARRLRTCKLFGRDSAHDDGNHRENFGRFLPSWGGRDLWLFEDPDPCATPGSPVRWASLNLDFEAL